MNWKQLRNFTILRFVSKGNLFYSRLKVLKLFESVALLFGKGSEDYRNKITTELRKMGLKMFLRTVSLYKNMKLYTYRIKNLKKESCCKWCEELLFLL